MRGVLGDALLLAGTLVGAAGWLITHDTDYLIPFATGFGFMVVRAVERVERAVRDNTAARRQGQFR